MPISGPLDVVSVQDIKDEAIIDYADDDVLISDKIRASISLIEQATMWRFYPRVETVKTSKETCEIFQWPLVSITAVNQDSESVVFKSIYEPLRTDIAFDYCNARYKTITINSGATELTQIPDNLIEAIKRQVVFLYENRDNQKAIIPDDVMAMISQFRRFTYF